MPTVAGMRASLPSRPRRSDCASATTRTVRRLTDNSRTRRLDVARETWRENTSDVNDLCDTLRDKYGLEGLTLMQGGKGSAYGFQLTKEEWEEKKGEIGKAFTNVVRFSSPVRPFEPKC